MLRLARASIYAVILVLAHCLPARALDSASASFSNSRSAIDSGGARKLSASYRLDASQGAISAPLGASAGYRNRDGFVAMAYQPARITDLTASSGALASLLPQAPFGLALASAGAAVTLTWMPVARFSNDLLFSSSTGAVSTDIQLRWTAPGNDGDENTTPGSYVIKYSSVLANSPAASNANFEAAATVPVAAPVPGQRGTVHTLLIPGLVGGVTYYFAIKAGERDGVRGARSAVAVGQIGTSTSPELSGYRVYRSTSLVQGVWTELAALSSSTVQYTDPLGGAQYFYAVRSENSAGLSARSILRSVGNKSAYSVAPDDRSYVEAKTASLAPIEGTVGVPMTAYLIQANDRPEYLGGRVVKSVEFTAKQGGAALSPTFELPTMGRLKLHYEVGASSVIASGVTAGVPATPDNLGVYWFNGVRWVQMYGTLNTSDQTINLDTKYLGLYQLRTVERTGGFNFDQSGISNRFVTPNGDGKNDAVVFTYDNPRDASVSVRILDRRGVVVASDLPQGPISNSRAWAPSASAPGGVYIYMIASEGRTFSGTIVVLK